MSATELRAATPDDAVAIAEVHVQAWHETYRGLIPEAIVDGIDVASRIALWRRAMAQGTALWLSLAEGVIVGFAAGGPARDMPDGVDAELRAIYVLRAHERLGHGRGLVAAIAGDLHAAGHRGMGLWVLTTNPARGFYEHLGARPFGERTLVIAGHPLDHIAYGFDDLPGLAGMAPVPTDGCAAPHSCPARDGSPTSRISERRCEAISSLPLGETCEKSI